VSIAGVIALRDGMKYTAGDREALPEEMILVRADLDENGGMPEEVDHIETRGAHPEKKFDVRNLRGVSAKTHRKRHTCTARTQCGASVS
jgi:hypothetical protein